MSSSAGTTYPQSSSSPLTSRMTNPTTYSMTETSQSPSHLKSTEKPVPILQTFDSPPSTLLSFLRQHLPYTIVLYRRLQYHLLQPNDPHGRIIVVSPSVQSDDEEGFLVQKDKKGKGKQKENEALGQWLIAHVDLSNVVEAAVWLCGSWELPAVHGSYEDSEHQREDISVSKTYLRALLRHIKDELLPGRPANQDLSTSITMSRFGYEHSTILFGSVHEKTLEMLHEMAGKKDGIAIAGVGIGTDALLSAVNKKLKIMRRFEFDQDDEPFEEDLEGEEQGNMWSDKGTGEDEIHISVSRTIFPYLKYIFPLQFPTSLPGQSITGLPENFTMRPLTQSFEFEYVITQIRTPRTIATLCSVPNIGIYDISPPEPSPIPIAWAFLGVDGSLNTMRVEDEYRGRGFAAVMARELFRMVAEARGFSPINETQLNAAIAASHDLDTDLGDQSPSSTTEWAHADVGPSNKASQRVMVRLGATTDERGALAPNQAHEGARIGWKVGWTEIEIVR